MKIKKQSMTKRITLGLVALAFVAGSITTSSMAFAAPGEQGKYLLIGVQSQVFQMILQMAMMIPHMMGLALQQVISPVIQERLLLELHQTAQYSVQQMMMLIQVPQMNSNHFQKVAMA